LLALHNATAYLIARSEGFAIHEKALRERPQDYGALARDRLTIGAYVRASDMVQAMRRRQMLVEATTAAMGGVDAILLPTAPDPAPRLADLAPYFGNQRPTYMRPFNLTGQPALSVCNGFDNAGLPLSLQIVGRCFDEAMVLRIGHAYERANPLFGIPVVVGVPDAVIAIRKICPNEGGVVMVNKRPAARVARRGARSMGHLVASARW